jgi:hypothetical protein
LRWQFHQAQQNGLASAIANIGLRGFDGAVARMIHTEFQVPYFAVYGWQDGYTVLHMAGAEGAPDVAPDCWRIYNRDVLSSDIVWNRIKPLLRSRSCITSHLLSSDIANRHHRMDIYLRHDLKARLSAYSRLGDGMILSCNIYRTSGQPDFDETARQRWSDAAPLIMTTLARHLDLANQAAPTRPEDVVSKRLGVICPALSDREREVLALLMVGRSYKEVGRILNIGPATAKTYRERGLRRMDVSTLYDARRITG